MAAPGGERVGLFVTLEGGEGAGKSVQLEALGRRLEAAGVAHTLTREPGDTALGEALRAVLLSPHEGVAIDAMSETLLFLAARAQLVTEVIVPALARGDVVLCDRFADSTAAYQGFGRGVDLATIERLNAIATQGLQPDLTVLLDLPAAEGIERTRGRGELDRFGAEEAAFHERVRRGYLELARREPERWRVVDASRDAEAVTADIWREIGPLLARGR